jgi:hypothetical protein
VSYPQLLTPEEKLADAKKLLSLPRIVVICGSTRFMTEMNEADLRETKAGKIVVKPGCDMKSPHELWSGPAEAEALKARLDDQGRQPTGRPSAEATRPREESGSKEAIHVKADQGRPGRVRNQTRRTKAAP